MFSSTKQVREITHDFNPISLALKTCFHRSWYRGLYTSGDQFASFWVSTKFSIWLYICIFNQLTSWCTLYNLCFHQPNKFVKSPMISSLLHSLWKRVFIGHDIEVYTPIVFSLCFYLIFYSIIYVYHKTTYQHYPLIIYLSIYLSMYLSIYLSIYIYSYLSIYT